MDLSLLKFGFRPDEAAQAIGSEELFRLMCAAGWIRPVVRKHKLTLYDRADLAKAWERILAGDYPSRPSQPPLAALAAIGMKMAAVLDQQTKGAA